MKKCPFCAEEIQDEARICRYCQRDLVTGQPPMTQQVIVAQRAWSPGVAAVLSLVIPGAGQMYKGRVGLGFAWLFVVAIGYIAFILPGLVLHICCIVNAASGSPAPTPTAARVPAGTSPVVSPTPIGGPYRLCPECAQYIRREAMVCPICHPSTRSQLGHHEWLWAVSAILVTLVITLIVGYLTLGTDRLKTNQARATPSTLTLSLQRDVQGLRITNNGHGIVRYCAIEISGGYTALLGDLRPQQIVVQRYEGFKSSKVSLAEARALALRGVKVTCVDEAGEIQTARWQQSSENLVPKGGG